MCNEKVIVTMMKKIASMTGCGIHSSIDLNVELPKYNLNLVNKVMSILKSNMIGCGLETLFLSGVATISQLWQLVHQSQVGVTEETLFILSLFYEIR